MRVRARPAEPADRSDLERLAALATSHVLAERGGDVLLARDPDRCRAPGDDADLVVVGCIGDVVVGYAAVTGVPTASGPVAEVRSLFVEPGARGVGVGRAVMEHAVAWASSQGCVGVDAAALPGDRATKNFFEAFGLVARLIAVHRPLTPGG